MTSKPICVCSLFQALLANISAMYAVYHGPDGLKEIGCNVHSAACLLALGNIIYMYLFTATGLSSVHSDIGVPYWTYFS